MNIHLRKFSLVITKPLFNLKWESSQVSFILNLNHGIMVHIMIMTMDMKPVKLRHSFTCQSMLN